MSAPALAELRSCMLDCRWVFLDVILEVPYNVLLCCPHEWPSYPNKPTMYPNIELPSLRWKLVRTITVIQFMDTLVTFWAISARASIFISTFFLDDILETPHVAIHFLVFFRISNDEWPFPPAPKNMLSTPFGERSSCVHALNLENNKMSLPVYRRLTHAERRSDLILVDPWRSGGCTMLGSREIRQNTQESPTTSQGPQTILHTRQLTDPHFLI